MLFGFLHKRILILLCSFLLVIQSSKAQIGALEDSVFTYRSLTASAANDSLKQELNKKVVDILTKALAEPDALEYPFKKLTSISIKNLPDNQTRIFTWNVATIGDKQEFYGLILHQHKKESKVIQLFNNHKVGNEWEKQESGADNWLGAIYYEIVPVDKKNSAFFLLGWRGVDRLISQKVIDVLHFEKGMPRFGQPIIKHGNSWKHRVLFTYPADIPFSLQYDKKQSRIVFDRIAPNDPKFAGNYLFYSPQFIFDAYQLENKQWTLKQDVSVTMPERKKPTIPKGPPAKQPQ